MEGRVSSYSAREVEQVLRLSRGTIRGLIDIGFVKPARGARREYRFSFQDLIVLRAARALIQAKVSRRRIRRSLEDLRKHLPETLPLSGLSITAIGDRVVVRDGVSHFQVDDGQYVLGLDVVVEQGVLRVVERAEPAASAQDRQGGGKPGQGGKSGRGGQGGKSASKTAALAGTTEATGADEESIEDWFAHALDLEETDPRGALTAYERATAADVENVSAWINWGRLLHDQGRTRESERVYRRALEQLGPDSLLMFNLGVLLEDLGRISAALEAYQGAISEDPLFADCHYNLARLYESLGKPQHAIRHLGQYRRLTTSDSR